MEFSSSRETKWSFAVRQRRDRHRRRRHSGPENSTSRREIAPPARTKTASLKTFRKIKFNSETFCFFFFSFTFYEMTLSKKFFVRVLCHMSLSSRVEANFKTFSSSTLIKAKIWPTTSTIIQSKSSIVTFQTCFFNLTCREDCRHTLTVLSHLNYSGAHQVPTYLHRRQRQRRW